MRDHLITFLLFVLSNICFAGAVLIADGLVKHSVEAPRCAEVRS